MPSPADEKDVQGVRQGMVSAKVVIKHCGKPPYTCTRRITEVNRSASTQ